MTLYTLSCADVGNLILDNFDQRRTTVWIETNIPENVIIDSASGNTLRLGDAKATWTGPVSFEFADLVPTNAVTNPTNFQYRVWIDYALSYGDAAPRGGGKPGRGLWDSGWFSFTANAELADVVAEQYVPPTWMTTATATLQTYVDEAEAARDATVDISGISTSDAVVEALVKNTGGAGPLTSAALAATFVPLSRAASTTQQGIVELATNAETTTGTDTVRAVTPAAGFAAYVQDGAAFADLGKQTGVDNTGTTECAAALNTALDGFAALGVRAYAKGTFKIASTVTIKGNADLGDATFNYTAATGTAVLVGSATSGTAVSRINVKAPKVIAVAKTVVGWAQVAGTIGVDISNLYSSTVHIPHVQGFETNHRTYGKGIGCVYNTISFGHLDNGKVNHLCDASATGWCNENLFLGGRFSHDSGEGTSVAGTRHIQTTVTTNPIDNNLWIKPSIEGDVPEYHADIAGVANTILQGRWEATTPKVRWNSNAVDNKIRGGYNAGSVVETWVAGAAGTNDLEGHLRTYYTRSGGTKGAWIEETTSSANDPIRVGMDPGARAAAANPATAYRYQFGATYYRGKRATDANPRVQIDHTNGRLSFGNGTAALGAYMYGTASIFILNGGGLSFEADNTYDLGGASLRPRDVIVGRNVRAGQVTGTGVVQTGSGVTASRPGAGAAGVGAMWFDTTLGKPIWSNGTNWVDATGTTV